MKKQNGITLISLIITIIIMLILAGVSLSMVMGDGSMLDQANAAAANTRIAEVQEYIDLAVANNKLAKYSKIGVKSKDALATEMVSQGLITEIEKDKMLANEELKINDVVINYGDIETTYNDAISAGEVEEGTKLSGTWTFKENLTVPSNDLVEDIEFNTIVDGQRISYNNIGIYADSQWGISLEISYNQYLDNGSLGMDSATMYTANSWYDDTVQNITFTSEQAVSQAFYEWFTANATKN